MVVSEIQIHRLTFVQVHDRLNEALHHLLYFARRRHLSEFVQN